MQQAPFPAGPSHCPAFLWDKVSHSPEYSPSCLLPQYWNRGVCHSVILCSDGTQTQGSEHARQALNWATLQPSLRHSRMCTFAWFLLPAQPPPFILSPNSPPFCFHVMCTPLLCLGPLPTFRPMWSFKCGTNPKAEAVRSLRDIEDVWGDRHSAVLGSSVWLRDVKTQLGKISIWTLLLLDTKVCRVGSGLESTQPLQRFCYIQRASYPLWVPRSHPQLQLPVVRCLLQVHRHLTQCSLTQTHK